MVNQEPLLQRWGNEKTDIRFRGKPGFQASSSPLEYTQRYVRFLLHINGSLMAILSTKPDC